ncbi:PREDICTED: gastrula zinc finger protein XlCGF57.1-like [Cyprinodon variegatus]|uniref:Gastrula zinc finger protein XlCGF57.1-like n=1 Tax=Cyprinodon variegatus TaxID=28743 RepID=A0A3Q2CQW0_CYPVA|nr:PREDICTED: gastrula zinc finger protein XlCGF57.1-like [Cyprinodon variegatus]
MKEVDYVNKNSRESLPLEDNVRMKQLGGRDSQDVGRNQSADVYSPSVNKEELPWSPSLDEQESESSFLKEEVDQSWTSQEEAQTDREDETEYINFPLNVIVKSEYDDEEEPESSQLHPSKTDDSTETERPTTSTVKWIKTETDGDCAQLELVWKPGPKHFKKRSDRKAADSSETDISEDDGYDYWQQPLTEKESGWKASGSVNPNCSEAMAPPGPKAKGHVGKRNFSCDECGKKFRDQFSLKSHIRVHTGEQPFVCDVCGKRFKHQHDVKKHMKVHSEEQPFVCEVCGKRFKHQHNLKTHMRIHTGEKPYICNICGKAARHQNNLRTHMIVHGGEQPFSCDICGKKFNRQTNLKAHKAVHTGEKPHSCEICGKSYKRRTHLRGHMTTHSEERPFGCEVCGKRFNRKTYLHTHMVVHTGEKPYSCDFCGKNFSRKTHLDSHIAVHMGGQPFGCPVCGEEFPKQESLDRHMPLHFI